MFLNSLDWENKIQQANTIASEVSNLPKAGGLLGIVQHLAGGANSNLAEMGISGDRLTGNAGLLARLMHTQSPALGKTFGEKGAFGPGGPLSILGKGTRGGILGALASSLKIPGRQSQGESGPMSIMGALAQTGAIPDLPPIQGAATGGQPVPIPVIPYDDQQGISNQIPGNVDLSNITKQAYVDFTDINKQAQESTKKLYPWWWEEHGPKGTGWFGPGDPRDLTD